jgi:membrane protease subunit HflK
MTMRYVLAAAVLILLGSLATGLAQIRPGERAVVRRFGRVVATPGPGLWVGLPWGMDRVDRVPVDRVRRVTVGFNPEENEGSLATPPGQLLTGDHNLVNVQAVISYAVDDNQVVAFVEHEDRADDLIARTAEAVLAEWIASRGIDDVLLRGKIQLPATLVSQTQARIEPYHLGVRIQEADVAHLFPPSEVKDAFDAVTRAQTSIRTLEQEALQKADTRRREAETERFQIAKQTEAYATERLRLARAEAERFEKRLYQYQHLRQGNPDFLAGIWWDEMGRLFARLKESGRLDLLDNHLGADGLDISVFPPMPGKK